MATLLILLLMAAVIYLSLMAVGLFYHAGKDDCKTLDTWIQGIVWVVFALPPAVVVAVFLGVKKEAKDFYRALVHGDVG